MLTAAAIILVLSKLTSGYIKFTELAKAIKENKVGREVITFRQLLLPSIAIIWIVMMFYAGYKIGGRSSDSISPPDHSVDASEEIAIISKQNERIKQLQHVSDSLELQLTSIRKRTRPKRILEEVNRNNNSIAVHGGDSSVYNFYLQRADRHFRQEGNTADIYPHWE